MSNPDDSAATPDNPGQGSEQNLSFLDKVNAATKTLTKGEDGNYHFPDDIELSEEVQVAAMAEKRRRDTQSALAKERAQVTALSAENTELQELVKKQMQFQMTPEMQEELDELKVDDPDAWRVKMNELEQSATKHVESTLSEISEKSKTSGALGEREILLQAFKDDNPGFEISDEILQNDVPPRITKKLEEGEVTFLQFLEEVRDYLAAGKRVQSDTPEDNPNLTELGGGDTPSENAQRKGDEVAYEEAIF